jgi:RNA 3'-terminal phosphate cyclase (ATP)
MVHIDGSEQSGSGTIVRFAVALAALLGRPLTITNARARRPKPGLRPQHVAAVRACCELCGGRAEGLAVGAREFTFTPGPRIAGGTFAWDIGTAGSTTMLALGILPIVCFAERPVVARITGGVFQDFAPSPYHMAHVLGPLLRVMGVELELEVIRAGYVPLGAGVIELRIRSPRRSLTPFVREEPGTIRKVTGLAFASHLAERRVSERMAASCEARLASAGLTAQIARVEDTAALHAGASLAVWATTSTDATLGADRAGARGRSSESIGGFVAESLLADVATGATVDRHVADQLLVFTALAAGTSRYRAPCFTDHVRSNLWLAERFGATARADDGRIRVDGIGFAR